MMKAWRWAIQYLAVVLLIVVAMALLSSCGTSGSVADPSSWGYNISVTYNAMGGFVSQREIRQTFYAEGSVLFEPSGTTGFLVDPKKEGFTLAGWYTDFTEIQNDDGTVSYAFDPQDRWDFNFERVEEDTTLYAYWIPKATLQYIRVMPDGSKDPFFSKELSQGSGIIALEPVLEKITGFTFFGYYDDPECTVAHGFSSETNSSILIPPEQDLFDTLALQFPSAFVTITPEEVEEAKEALKGSTNSTQESAVDDIDIINKRDPYLFIEQYGYRLVDTSPETVAEILRVRNEIIGAAIATYTESVKSTQLYMKYIEGNFRRVRSVNDVISGGKVSLSGSGYDGYIITADLDFTGFAVKTEDFSGTIYGNGHTISGLNFSVNSGKGFSGDEFSNVGLWSSLKDTTIYNLNFKDCTLGISESSQASMYVAFLAGYAENVKLSDCRFENILIRTGGSESKPLSLRSGYVAIVGDLFANKVNVTMSNCPLINCTLEISGSVQTTSDNAFGGVTAPEPDPEEPADEPTVEP